MAEAKKRLTEMFFKYLEIFGLIAVGMFLGWLLFGYPAHASLGDVVYNNDVKETVMEDIEYPFTLSYTTPDGENVSVEIKDEGQSEDEYHKMFETCGYDVPFSVD